MPLAILFAALDPLNLRGIVLCEGFASSALRAWRRELTWESVPLLSHVTMPEFVAKYLLVRGGSAGAGAVGDNALSWVTPEVLAGRMRDVLKVDARGELTRVAVWGMPGVVAVDEREVDEDGAIVETEGLGGGVGNARKSARWEPGSNRRGG